MRLGYIFGVEVRVNIFFLLLLVVYAATGYLTQVLVVYGAALLHEITHAIVAVSYGLKVDQIEILPFGGVARIRNLDLLALNPQVEAAVAIAGPAENLLMAFAAHLLVAYGLWNRTLADLFVQANLALAFFNLLPALPLDGGRILRAYLTRRFSWKLATDIASRLGQAIGALLVCLGVALLRHGWLFINTVFLGIFVFFAAVRERQWADLVLFRYLAHKQKGLEQDQVSVGVTLVASADTKIGRVIDEFVAGRYHVICVLDKDYGIMAIISEDDFINGLLANGPNLTLGNLVAKK